MYNSLNTGRKSGIGPSGVQLVASDIVAQNGVQIYADVLNTADVFVGNSGLTSDTADTTDGFPIPAENGLFIPIRHPSSIYVRTASVTAQKLWWILL